MACPNGSGVVDGHELLARATRSHEGNLAGSQPQDLGEGPEYLGIGRAIDGAGAHANDQLAIIGPTDPWVPRTRLHVHREGEGPVAHFDTVVLLG